MAVRGHAGNRLSGLMLGLALVAAADARTIYVDDSAGAGGNTGQSWADAYTDLSAALWDARAGDEIWVAQGTYTPGSQRDNSFDLRRACGAKIRGGYAGLEKPGNPNVRNSKDYPTKLSGDLQGDDELDPRNTQDNSYHVVTGAGTDPYTLLEGFIITGGRADGRPEDRHGSGLYNGGGGLTVRDCHFVGNVCQDRGGAVFNKAGRLTLDRCRFSDNSAARGGAVYNLDSRPVLIACTFIGNWATMGGGIYDSNSPAELIGCAFYRNWAGDGGGIYNDVSTAHLTNCLFSGNSAELGGGLFNSNCNPALVNCTLSRNSANDRSGGLYNYNASPTLTNCILYANNDAGGMDYGAQLLTVGGVPTVRYCCIQGWTAQQGGWENTGEYPRFVDDDGPDNTPGTEDDDLSLRGNSPALDAGDNSALPFDTYDLDHDGDFNEPIPFDIAFDPQKPRVSNGRVDLGAFEARVPPRPGLVIFVNARSPGPGDGSCWAKALVSLQEALETARVYQKDGPREIWVAAGTYTPADPNGPRPRDASFELVKDVSVYGGFAGFETTRAERDPNRNVTILSGDFGHPQDAPVTDAPVLLAEPTRADNCFHVVTGSNTDATAVLDGFTIAGGMANGTLWADGNGGGIYIRAGSPTIQRCTFRDNAATGCGGAIYCLSSAPTIRTCTIRGNAAETGGGVYCDSNSPTIQGSIITGNYSRGDGAGIACTGPSAPLIEGNTICGNRTLVESERGGGGGGIGCLGESRPQLLRNTIFDNVAYDGAGIYCRSAHPNIFNNLIRANRAGDDGGGICAIGHSFPTIRNNTIVRNRADPQGGGLFFENSTALVTSCILWENGDDFQNWTPTYDCNPTYCCIQDGDPGVGNISIYPHFVNPANDDYHLNPWSPCIDAGPSWADATIRAVHQSGERDLEGNLRVKFLIVDMGAYETAVQKGGADFDRDQDGLPDGWERQQFGGLEADPNDDPDGDGYSNLVEYQKGALPKFYQLFIHVRKADNRDPRADGSPGHPFASIQQAIDAAVDGGHILVTEGIFEESLTIDNKTLYIDGGYSREFTPDGGATILDAGGKAQGVLYNNVPGGRLTGFTIRNGKAKDGGGMYLWNSSPRIWRNTIEDNHAEQDGGGVSFYGQLSRPLFEDNIVRNNRAYDNAGGLYCRDASPQILRCTITENTAKDGGGALRVRGAAEPNLVDCNIVGNHANDEGGAILCRESRDAEPAGAIRLTRCTIRDNTADGRNGRGGLVLRPDTRATIRDCNIVDNTAPALWAHGSTIQIGGVVEILARTRDFQEETRAGTWSLQDTDVVRDPNAAGAAELHTGPRTVLQMNDCSFLCDLTGSASVVVRPESELRIEGRAVVNLATDPKKKGLIWCRGLLYLGDHAQITGTEIRVARASFEGDVDITNSIIRAEAGVPSGQFFVADEVNIVDSDIHADGDRYMDLNPAVFRGLLERNKIFVEITEGVGHTRGGLFELRGLDLYRAPNDSPDQFLYARPVPDFNTVTWTVEELKLAPGAKLNLTNRFAFQPDDQGGGNEVLYVRKLVMGPNSVLNTAFNRVYYETEDINDSAVIESVPLLGFSLNNIAFDNANEFAVRVTTNNIEYDDEDNEGLKKYNRIGVQRREGMEPDTRGLMEMCNLPDPDEKSPTFGKVIPARAKGLFAKSNEPMIEIRFEYLFCDPAGGGELVIYLTDNRELLRHDDHPGRDLHYREVARLLHPPAGSPGSAGSGRWGVFEEVVPAGGLDFLRGTRIELELLGPGNTRVLINNWDPGIECSNTCGDVAWPNNLVTEVDFLAVLSECGRRVEAVAESEKIGRAGCLDGFFCNDRYVTIHDALAADWNTLHSRCASLTLLAGLELPPYAPLVAAAVPTPAGAGVKHTLTVAAVQTQASAAPPALGSRFLIAAKRYLHRDGRGETEIDDFLSDRLYGLNDEGSLVSGLFPELDTDRFRNKLVRDRAGHLYQLSLARGLVRLADNITVVAPHCFRDIPEPRYGASASVYIGLQGFERDLPLLDAAFDVDVPGCLYVVPVVVALSPRDTYVATAKLMLDNSGQDPGYRIVQLFDDKPLDNDNHKLNRLREVEVDRDGGVYVLNCHSLNNSDILWVYRSDGAGGFPARRYYLQDLGISAPVGLCVSSYDSSRLYLSSSENRPDADRVKVFVRSTADLSPLQEIEILNMGHVTDITEDPADGTICVVGFQVPRIPLKAEIQDWRTLQDEDPFYQPRLAIVAYDGNGPVEATRLSRVSTNSDIALPLSVVCSVPYEDGAARVELPADRSP